MKGRGERERRIGIRNEEERTKYEEKEDKSERNESFEEAKDF